MNKDTKIEIVIGGGVAVLLAWLWLANRKAGAGTGMENFWPALGLSQPDDATGTGGGTLPVIAATPGDTFNYTPGNINMAPVTTAAPNVTAPSSCGCGCGDTTTIQYASTPVMMTAIAAAATPANLSTAALTYAPITAAPTVSTAQIISDMNYGSGSLVMGATPAQTGQAMQAQFAAWSAPGSNDWM